MADDTYVRTVQAITPQLSAKKAGQLTRAMKDYRRVREFACERFREPDVDPTEFTYSEREDLRQAINAHPRIDLPARAIYPAITTVRQNYEEYVKEDDDASEPKANRADVLGLDPQDARLFHNDGRYYLTINTGPDRVIVPLVVSSDAYHQDRLPHPDAVPDTTDPRQCIPGVQFRELEPEDFPADTVGLGSSTLSKIDDRQFRANLTFEIKKRVARQTDGQEARFIVGVDRGRNQLASACVYDREEDHVVDWWDRSGDEVGDRMDQLAERISDVQRAGVIDEMLRLRSRRRRYKRQVDYEIANEIVRLARERFDTAIAIEELSGISRLGNYAVENRRFNEWSYYRLGKYIEEKAEPYDIPVEEVPPAYTSQTCSRCGEAEATRRSGVHFECRSCGYQQHADANASVMIAKKLAAQ